MGTGRGYDRELANFERRAGEYKQKEEKEKKLKALALRRAGRLIRSLQESVIAFGRSLCDLPPEERAACAGELLQGSLRSVGDVDYIHWSPGGCEITFEPWAERRLRRKHRASTPVLFRARVDDHLRLTDCVQLEGEQYEASRRESIVDRIHAALQRHGRTPDVLEDSLSQMGRVVGRTKMNDGGIKASVEPWEEVRRRKIERGGRRPAKAYMVSADAAMESIRCEPC